MDLIGFGHPWLGLAYALGALAVLGAWYLLASASEGTRLVALATGAVFLVVHAGGIASRIVAAAGIAASPGYLTGHDSSTHVAALLLGLAGLVVGLAVALHVDDEAAGGETPGEGLPEEDEAVAARPGLRLPYGTARRLLLLAAGLALPITSLSGPVPSAFGLGRTDVTGWHVAAAILVGVGAAAALLPLALSLDLDLTDRPYVVAAFAVVAAGVGAGIAWPATFSNTIWAWVATGLAIGLVVPLGLRAIRDVLPGGRPLVAGIAVALAVLALGGLARTEVLSRLGPDVGDVTDDGGIGVVPQPAPSFPPLPTIPEPTFSFPTFP